MIELGSKAKDTVTGFSGTVVSITHHLGGASEASLFTPGEMPERRALLCRLVLDTAPKQAAQVKSQPSTPVKASRSTRVIA